MIGPDINKNEGGLVSQRGLVTLPQTGWNYTINNTWTNDDDTLKLTEGEPDYPVQIKVASSGEAAQLYPDAMGEYRKIKGDIRNGRPVWKHIDNNIFLYYAGGTHNHWNIGPSTNVEDGEWIHTKKFAQVKLLEIEWIYIDEKMTIRDDDESLKVTDDK